MREYILYSSTDNFGRFIVENTNLKKIKIQYKQLVESDANRPKEFYKLPDRLKQLMYLDAADAILTVDGEPMLVIEESHEAGTGHNVFQRFPRLAAAAENNVPCLYIYPEAAIVERQNSPIRWDPINPLIFKAMTSLLDVCGFPSLLFYYPSLYKSNKSNLIEQKNKGLLLDDEYLGCPKRNEAEIKMMFNVINDFMELIGSSESLQSAKTKFKSLPSVRERIGWMSEEFYKKSQGRDWESMSPLSSCFEIDTTLLVEYLKRFEDSDYKIGNLLKSRSKTLIYKVDAKFRGDPYPGCLAAIDYLMCRYGDLIEERSKNLVMLWGDFKVNDDKLEIIDNGKSMIDDFFLSVRQSEQKNLLTSNFNELKNWEIPRYFMQLRYGTAFTKTKHVRVYSHFADAIIFPDGSIWRD